MVEQSGLLDEKWYLERYPDVARAGVDPVEHYLRHGSAEGRNPSPEFDTAWYIESFPDVARSEINPLVHYVRFGRAEGRPPAATARPESPEGGRAPLILPFGSASILNQHLAGTVAVHLHLDDPTLAEEFLLHLRNVPLEFVLLVSVLHEEDVEKTASLFARTLDRCTDCRVRRVPEGTRAIDSLFLEFGPDLTRLRYVCHIHSTAAPSRARALTWRQHLLAHLLGSERTVTAVLERLHDDPGIGMLLPAPQGEPATALLVADPLEGKGGAVAPTLSAADDSASMFWLRVDAVRSLLEGEPASAEGARRSSIRSLQGLPSSLASVCEVHGYRLAQYRLPVDPEFLYVYWKARPFVDRLDEREHESRLRRYRSRTGRARIVVYTAVTGSYDRLLLPEALDPEVDYVCFTDAPIDDLGVWKSRPIPWHDPDPVRRARYVKTHPHVLLDEYDVALWADANLLIRGSSPRAWIDKVRREGKQVGLITHPRRSSIEEEADYCVAAERDDTDTILRQVARYRAERVAAELLLPETGFMVLFHHEAAVQAALAAWWTEIRVHSRRDQLSCGFALRQAGVDPSQLLPAGYSVRNHPGFALMPHGEASGYRVPAFVASCSRRLDPDQRARFAEVRARELARIPARSVEVVVCVHDALGAVRPCLQSVLEHRTGNERLIIVDDASGAETAAFLRQLASSEEGVELRRHETRHYYCRAANSALRRTTADFVVLLNSDTIVSPQWAGKLLHCAQLTRAGMVGPLSNAASWQSVPRVEGTGSQTAVNPLPAGVTPADLDRFCEQWAYADLFPSVSLLHGFCLGMTRELIDTVGEFDEMSFPLGYGEEDDYCLRAVAAGFVLAVAVHTYVFHAKSKSYTTEGRAAIAGGSHARLREKHGDTLLDRAVAQSQTHPLLERMRGAIASLYEERGGVGRGFGPPPGSHGVAMRASERPGPGFAGSDECDPTQSES